MMRCTWVLSLLILILPACLQRSRARTLGAEHNALLCSSLDNLAPVKVCPEVRVDNQANGSDYQLMALALEAKFGDIPIPLGSEPICDFFTHMPTDSMSIMFGYTNVTEASSLYNFFKTECLRLGWRLMGGIQSIESMLTFEKPDRICTISLRPLEAATALIITVCSKNKESSTDS